MNFITRVVSGGQTGADQAGLRAAKVCGIPTGGWAPFGYRTEDGMAPWLADFGLQVSVGGSYSVRTKENVRDSDGTLAFIKGESIGTTLTWKECDRQGKPFRGVLIDKAPGAGVVVCRYSHDPESIAEWIVENNIRVLNVAGNRESKAKGIGELAEKFCVAVFRQLAKRKAAKAKGATP